MKPDKVPSNGPKRSSRSTRSDYGEDHKRFVAIAIQRHPFCQVKGPECTGWTRKLQGHHKVYPARGPDDYVVTCQKCHKILDRQRNDESS